MIEEVIKETYLISVFVSLVSVYIPILLRKIKYLNKMRNENESC